MNGELETDHDVLVTLHRFTLATTEQLHQLHGGAAGIKQTQKRLTRLQAEGPTEFVTLPRAGRAKAWHLTAAGSAVTATFPEALRPGAPCRARRSRRCGTGASTCSTSAGSTPPSSNATVPVSAPSRRRGDRGAAGGLRHTVGAARAGRSGTRVGVAVAGVPLRLRRRLQHAHEGDGHGGA
ncbi:replication-relaxation family protein [Kitasatospora sp. NPDC004240]